MKHCILSICDHPGQGVKYVRFVFQLSHQTLWQNWWDLCFNYLIQLCLRIDEIHVANIPSILKRAIYTDAIASKNVKNWENQNKDNWLILPELVTKRPMYSEEALLLKAHYHQTTCILHIQPKAKQMERFTQHVFLLNCNI